jgi:hypothetical protein
VTQWSVGEFQIGQHGATGQARSEKMRINPPWQSKNAESRKKFPYHKSLAMSAF